MVLASVEHQVTNIGCYSAFFPTNGVSYQYVCGRTRGYQKGATDGLHIHTHTESIDTYYVKGLSITHGNPCQHIYGHMYLDLLHVSGLSYL